MDKRSGILVNALNETDVTLREENYQSKIRGGVDHCFRPVLVRTLLHFTCFTAVSCPWKAAENLLHPEAAPFHVVIQGCQHLKTPYKQMKRLGPSLWKCNKVVFLECGKQIRLTQSCLVTQTQSRLGLPHLCSYSSFSAWFLVTNQMRSLLGPRHHVHL